MVKVCKEEGISKSETAASGVRVPLLCLLMREFFTERYIVEFILFCVSFRRIGDAILPIIRKYPPQNGPFFLLIIGSTTRDHTNSGDTRPGALYLSKLVSASAPV